MERTLHIDFNTATGPVRPMHATNNGPINGVGIVEAGAVISLMPNTVCLLKSIV